MGDKMKIAFCAAAVLIMTGCSPFQPLPVKLDSVTPCTGKLPAENEGSCAIRGVTAEGTPVEGNVFTWGERGDWILLQCSENNKCRATAEVIEEPVNHGN